MLNNTQVTPQEILTQFDELKKLVIENEAYFGETHNDDSAIHLYIERLQMPAWYDGDAWVYELHENGYSVRGSLEDIEAYLSLFVFQSIAS